MLEILRHKLQYFWGLNFAKNYNSNNFMSRCLKYTVTANKDVGDSCGLLV